MSAQVKYNCGLTVTYHAPEYATTVVYTYGDVVTYNGLLYQCIASTKGAWLPSHWRAATLEQLINDELEKPSE